METDSPVCVCACVCATWVGGCSLSFSGYNTDRLLTWWKWDERVGWRSQLRGTAFQRAAPFISDYTKLACKGAAPYVYLWFKKPKHGVNRLLSVGAWTFPFPLLGVHNLKHMQTSGPNTSRRPVLQLPTEYQTEVGASACLGNRRKWQWPVLVHHLEASCVLYLIRTRSCMHAE